MNEQLQTPLQSDRPTITLETSDVAQIRWAQQQLHRVTTSVPVFDKNLDLIFATVTLSDLKVGKNLANVRHYYDRQNRHKAYYSTQLVNTTSEPIRIDRFSTYIRKGKTLVLHSITGGFFSGQQFQGWYSLDREWIEPGQIVIDPNNHSNPDVYWVYFGTTASGQEFTTGMPWHGGKSWWRFW